MVTKLEDEWWVEQLIAQAGLHHDLAAIVDEVAQRRHLDREAEADVGDEDLAADGGGGWSGPCGA